MIVHTMSLQTSLGQAGSSLDEGFDKEDQKGIRADTAAFMQHHMREHGFETNVNVYHEAILNVLAKDTIGEARKEQTEFQQTRQAARDGARNYRSEAAKLTAAELLIHWSGLNKPYTSNNIKDLDKCYDYDVGHVMLEDDKYRVGLTGTDPFGCEDYRKILYATFPLSRTDLARLSDPAQRFFPHNSIRHMTPHMIAFADAKIRSMLKGEASWPKQASDEEITTMGEMVQGLQDGTLDSQYAVPRMSLEPFTPTGQML